MKLFIGFKLLTWEVILKYFAEAPCRNTAKEVQRIFLIIKLVCKLFLYRAEFWSCEWLVTKTYSSFKVYIYILYYGRRWFMMYTECTWSYKNNERNIYVIKKTNQIKKPYIMCPSARVAIYPVWWQPGG